MIDIETHVFTQDLSAGALSFSYTFTRRMKLLQALFGMSGAITQTLQIIHDANEGGDYDSVIDSKSLSEASDYVFRPAGECVFEKGDKIAVTCTNATETESIFGKIQLGVL